MRASILALIATFCMAASPVAKSDKTNNGNGNGASGCNSIGGTGSNPGQWYKSLSQNPLLQGLTPSEMADLENTTPGWVGYEQTPNVGAAIQEFCGN